MWIIKATSTDIHRWVKLKPTSKSNGKYGEKNVKYGKDSLYQFDANTIISTLNIPKPKKISSIDITTNKINVGELIMSTCATKKGKYDIYQYGKSLIAIHEDEDIMDKKFKYKGMVFCDIGMFSYTDTSRVHPYVHKKNLELDNTSLMLNNKIPQANDAYYLYTDDLEFDEFIRKELEKERKMFKQAQAKKFKSKSKRRNRSRGIGKNVHIKINKMISNYKAKKKYNPVGIFSGNGYGDGSYLFFSSKNAFWIMSDLVEKEIGDIFPPLLKT